MKFPFSLVDEQLLALVDFGGVALSVESITDDHTEYKRQRGDLFPVSKEETCEKNFSKVSYVLFVHGQFRGELTF